MYKFWAVSREQIVRYTPGTPDPPGDNRDTRHATLNDRAGVGVACHAMIAGSPATSCGSQCSLALGLAGGAKHRFGERDQPSRGCVSTPKGSWT
jgi:hypothetical protein